MLIADMIHSCSNAHVAEAAVSCIGGSFAERVCVMAGRSRMNAGRFVSIVVRDFARRANHETLVALNRKVAGAEAKRGGRQHHARPRRVWVRKHDRLGKLACECRISHEECTGSRDIQPEMSTRCTKSCFGPIVPHERLVDG